MAWSWKDVGAAVADVAPSIAGVLGNVILPGAGGVIAATAAKYLLDALGLGDLDSQAPETVQAAQDVILAGNPETLLKLREQDAAFKKDMAQIGVNLEEIAAKDRDSARKREMEVKDRTPSVLAFITVGGFLLTVLTILVTAIAGMLELGPVAAGLVGTIVGGVIAKTGDVFAYYYGTTRSSAQKDDTIMDLTRTSKGSAA